MTTRELTEAIGDELARYYTELGLPDLPRPYAAAEAVLAALARATLPATVVDGSHPAKFRHCPGCGVNLPTVALVDNLVGQLWHRDHLAAESGGGA